MHRPSAPRMYWVTVAPSTRLTEDVCVQECETKDNFRFVIPAAFSECVPPEHPWANKAIFMDREKMKAMYATWAIPVAPMPTFDDEPPEETNMPEYSQIPSGAADTEAPVFSQLGSDGRALSAAQGRKAVRSPPAGDAVAHTTPQSKKAAPAHLAAARDVSVERELEEMKLRVKQLQRLQDQADRTRHRAKHVVDDAVASAGVEVDSSSEEDESVALGTAAVATAAVAVAAPAVAPAADSFKTNSWIPSGIQEEILDSFKKKSKEKPKQPKQPKQTEEKRKQNAGGGRSKHQEDRKRKWESTGKDARGKVGKSK